LVVASQHGLDVAFDVDVAADFVFWQ